VHKTRYHKNQIGAANLKQAPSGVPHTNKNKQEGKNMFEFGRVTSMNTLQQAWRKISAKNGSSGIDGVDVQLYDADLENNLRLLQAALISGNYRPYEEKRYESKNRTICVSCVDDKIVQTALAEIVTSSYEPSKNVHGFIKNRSIFTAKSKLDQAIGNGITKFSKLDISRFYDSIDRALLMRKLRARIGDAKFLQLIMFFLNLHNTGVSTGSCLSPALTNLYLADFDNVIDTKSTFYSRYVDDILVAPVEAKDCISEELKEVNLTVNTKKSEDVDAVEGFRYLGFDVKHDIDDAILNGDFARAEELHSPEEVIQPPEPGNAEEPEQKPKAEIPEHINAVIEKCHIVRTIVEKAKTQKYLGYPDKSTLLQLFHCLGKDGAAFIHNTLGYCTDYDYAETERHIRKYSAPNPIGCRKLCERTGNNDKCTCSFINDSMYPSPIIHAKRIKDDCFTLSKPQDSIGHFRSKTKEHRAVDALSSLIELNKKEYEIREQQSVFKGQIEQLFDRNNSREFQTPQGLLIKNDDGIFIKVG